jgi:ribosome-associated translation inhibitor RaiA
MKLLCHVDSSFPSHVRESAEERIKQKLERFQDVIREVHLTVRDLNGPKGGVDTQCQVRVFGDHLEVIVDEKAETVSDAVGGALDRAVQNLARQRDARIRRRRGQKESAGE